MCFSRGDFRRKGTGFLCPIHWRMEPSTHFWQSGNAGRTPSVFFTLLPLSLTSPDPPFTNAALLSLLPGEQSHHATLSLLYGAVTIRQIPFHDTPLGKPCGSPLQPIVTRSHHEWLAYIFSYTITSSSFFDAWVSTKEPITFFRSFHVCPWARCPL